MAKPTGTLNDRVPGRCAQVLQRGGEPPVGGLALVDVEAAAVGEHHVEIVAAAEDVVPGEPVEDAVRPLLEELKDGGHLGLVGAHHPLGGQHPLGIGARARGEEDLREGVRADPGVGGIHLGVGAGRQQVGEGRHLARRPLGPDGDDLDALQLGEGERAGVAAGVVDEGYGGLHLVEHVGQPPVGLADQRVLLGERHGGDADILRGQRQKRVIDARCRRGRRSVSRRSVPGRGGPRRRRGLWPAPRRSRARASPPRSARRERPAPAPPRPSGAARCRPPAPPGRAGGLR